jgi:hypothetical protein
MLAGPAPRACASRVALHGHLEQKDSATPVPGLVLRRPRAWAVPPDPGEEASRLCRVLLPSGSVYPVQVGLLDQADLELEAVRNATSIAAATRLGTSRARPAAVAAVAVKIGLRTSRNGPLVTKAVRVVGSTSGRQEAPMASCAVSVAAMPQTTTTTPAARTGVRFRKGIGCRPARSASGGGHGAGEADSRQQPCPPLRRPGSISEAGDAGGPGTSGLDEGGQSSHQQQPDSEQDQGEDGHRRHHLLDHPDDPMGPVWIRPDRRDLHVSRPDRSGADQIDAEHQATDLAVEMTWPCDFDEQPRRHAARHTGATPRGRP